MFQKLGIGIRDITQGRLLFVKASLLVILENKAGATIPRNMMIRPSLKRISVLSRRIVGIPADVKIMDTAGEGQVGGSL